MTAAKFRFYLLSKIPLAFIAGVRLENLSESQCSLSLRHSWWNQNPFRSIYFGALAMCAEISTGLLLLSRIQRSGESISMLVTSMKADFVKKAKGKIIFTCALGKDFESAFSSVLTGEEGEVFILESSGLDEEGEIVATFYFEWSIKKRSQK